MPRSGAGHLPLEILAKGSISTLIKETSSKIAMPDPISPDPASDEQSLLDEHKKAEILIKDLQPNNNKFDPNIKNKSTKNTNSREEVENSIQYDKDKTSLDLVNELKVLRFRRISVSAQQSDYIDGIVAEVGRDFLIMITPQLSVVTIPLSSIDNFYIINP